MGVTINDIAKAAKVAPSTVSRVLADNPRISQETREKIQKIMKEMNYHPNMIARSLANKSTKIVGLVVPGTTEKAFQHPFMPEIIRGIISVAHKNGYKLLISSAADAKEEKKLISDLANGGIIDGVILMTSRLNDPAISGLIKANFPFAVVGRPANDDSVNWVDNNNYAIAYDLTKHFIARGHKKIAFLGVSSQVIVTLDRFNGYKKALQDNGIPFDEKLVVEGKFIDDTGYDLMKQLMARNVSPTGIIACDDFLAFGAIKLLTEAGLKVPDDIAVAGFNNTPLSDHFIPPLTSVEVNAYALGKNAFELLLADITSDNKSFNRSIVPAELIIRDSTDKNI
jgi:DNA-binding LacI/PurR family transcriptional regulator